MSVPSSSILLKCCFCNLLLCLNCMLLSAQFNEDVVFSRVAIIEDVKVIRSALLEAHPAIDEYFPKDSLERLFSRFVQQLPDSLSRIEFVRRITPLIKTIRCGHTNLAFPILPFLQQVQVARGKFPNTRKYLPIQLVAYDGQIKVLQQHSFFQQEVLGNLVQIDAFRTQDILNILPAYLNRDGYAPVEDYYYRYHLTEYFNNILLDWKTDSINILLEKDKELRALRFATVERPSRLRSPRLGKTWRKITPIKDEWISLNNPALFYSDSLARTALLKIAVFRGKRAAKALRDIFERLQKDRIEHLIIDLQGNRGGSILTSTELLQHTLQDSCSYHLKRKLYEKPSFEKHIARGKVAFKAKGERRLLKKIRKYSNVHKTEEAINISIFPKSKNHFDGQIYILTDGGSYSAAAMVSAFLQDKGRATIIGQETGGTKDQFSAILSPLIQLPNTECTLFVPLYQAKLHLQAQNFGRGVQADVMLQPTLEDILKRRDLALKEAMMLISQSKVRK